MTILVFHTARQADQSNDVESQGDDVEGTSDDMFCGERSWLASQMPSEDRVMTCKRIITIQIVQMARKAGQANDR